MGEAGEIIFRWDDTESVSKEDGDVSWEAARAAPLLSNSLIVVQLTPPGPPDALTRCPPIVCCRSEWVQGRGGLDNFRETAGIRVMPDFTVLPRGN